MCLSSTCGLINLVSFNNEHDLILLSWPQPPQHQQRTTSDLSNRPSQREHPQTSPPLQQRTNSANLVSSIDTTSTNLVSSIENNLKRLCLQRLASQRNSFHRKQSRRSPPTTASIALFRMSPIPSTAPLLSPLSLLELNVNSLSSSNTFLSKAFTIKLPAKALQSATDNHTVSPIQLSPIQCNNLHLSSTRPLQCISFSYRVVIMFGYKEVGVLPLDDITAANLCTLSTQARILVLYLLECMLESTQSS